jgi:hypothetical protein
MPIYFNDVLIPEDEENALSVNNANITEVYANGISVWAQQLFAAQWSGNSIAPSWDTPGITTSGNLFKSHSSFGSGAWISTYTNGTFQAKTSEAMFGSSSFDIRGYGDNRIGIRDEHLPVSSGLNFSINGGFSGASTSGYLSLQSSGGLMRMEELYFESAGAWISLT